MKNETTVSAASCLVMWLENTKPLHDLAYGIAANSALDGAARAAAFELLAADAAQKFLAELKRDGDTPDYDYAAGDVVALAARAIADDYARKVAEDGPSPDFVKIVRPGAWRDYPGGPAASVFCKVEYKAGRLSITGVVGPLESGNSVGGCGQIVMSMTEPNGAGDWTTFAPGWSRELAGLFLIAWDRWHLNDMNAADSEMKAAGWGELARREVFRYGYRLTREASAAKAAAEAAALAALKAGETFTPTPEQTAAVILPLWCDIWAYASEGEPAPPAGYERKKDHRGEVERPERKTLGWVKPTEHPDGLLGRKLREDGPGYGSAWFREEVPAEVLDFLRNLPATDRTPAWV